MSTVVVRRLHARDEIGESQWKQINDLENEIRQTSQRLFEARGGAPGDAEEDWVRAERQVCWAPQSELKESDGAFRLVIGIPGVNAEDVEVTLLPEMVIVRGNGIRDSDEAERVHFSDFGSGALFRRVPLPALVHVDSAVVVFEKNLLRVSAAKVEPNESPVGALAAANY